MVHVAEEGLSVSLYHLSIPPVWPVTGRITDRLPYPASRPLPITTPQNLLRIERLQEPGTRGLEECIIEHRST